MVFQFFKLSWNDKKKYDHPIFKYACENKGNFPKLPIIEPVHNQKYQLVK